MSLAWGETIEPYEITLPLRVQTGGHLGSSLGVVELTTALLHVFNLPDDKIVYDVGHQAYVHKMLTGRRKQMHTIRQTGGLSGGLLRPQGSGLLIQSKISRLYLCFYGGPDYWLRNCSGHRSLLGSILLRGYVFILIISRELQRLICGSAGIQAAGAKVL